MNRLHQLFAHDWAMRRHEVDSLMGIVMPCIVNGRPEAALSVLDKNNLTSMRVTPLASRMEMPWEGSANGGETPANSVIVLRMRGPLYAWTTEIFMDRLSEALADDNVVGIVLDIDGPGGQGSKVDQAAEMVRNSAKPIVTFVSGEMASAHFWIGSAAQYRIIASDMCHVGSVGAFTSWISFKKYYEQLGIDARDIYPDTSDLKNKESRALEDSGDEEPIKAWLQHMHMIFAGAVAKYLDIPYDADDPLFRGEMFTGNEAIARGIMHCTGTLDDAINKVLALSVLNSIQ